MISIFGKITLSFQTFRTHKLRSFLTTLGIVIGVMTVIAILSLIEGLNRSVAEQIQSLGSDLIYLQKFTWVSTGHRDLEKLANRPDLIPDDAIAITKLASVEIAIPEINRRLTNLKYRDNEVASPTITGSDENFAWVNNHIVESGRDLSRDDVLHRRAVGIIGSYIASNLFPDESPLGKDIYVNGHRVKIIGVFKEKGTFLGNSLDNFLLIPNTLYEKFFPRERGSIFSRVYGGYSIDIKPRTGKVEQAIDEIRELMRRRHGLTFDEDDDYELNTQQVLLDLYQNLTNVGFIAIVAIAAISLVVGGIGIMNIMLVSVAERTREIGIRKAVGASNQNILSQFLIESVVLALVGGIIGILLGMLLAALISAVSPLKAAVSLWMIALGFGFSASVGIFFGIYPARKAATLNPIEALRYE
ncbi:MAG: ABC transporter permease [candidate division WOR-3 bacterium]|nr:MAG: ABC transporter permease [candidate division WOR-3 bacterium]